MRWHTRNLLQAKTVRELQEEVAKGETKLCERDGRLIRYVEVLSLAVERYLLGKYGRFSVLGHSHPRTSTDFNKDSACRNGKVLWEAEQTFPDGRKRKRNVLLSEKLVYGENWRGAVPRWVTIACEQL